MTDLLTKMDPLNEIERLRKKSITQVFQDRDEPNVISSNGRSSVSAKKGIASASGRDARH